MTANVYDRTYKCFPPTTDYFTAMGGIPDRISVPRPEVTIYMDDLRYATGDAPFFKYLPGMTSGNEAQGHGTDIMDYLKQPSGGHVINYKTDVARSDQNQRALLQGFWNPDTPLPADYVSKPTPYALPSSQLLRAHSKYGSLLKEFSSERPSVPPKGILMDKSPPAPKKARSNNPRTVALPEVATGTDTDTNSGGGNASLDCSDVKNFFSCWKSNMETAWTTIVQNHKLPSSGIVYLWIVFSFLLVLCLVVLILKVAVPRKSSSYPMMPHM